MNWCIRKCSNDSKVTDFCFSIYGYILFSFMDIPDKKSRYTNLIIFNRIIYEREKF